MFKKFSTSQLVFLTLMGVLLSLNDIFLSNALTLIIGIPTSGAIVTTIIFVAIATIGAFSVRKFGAITIMLGIWGFLYGLSGASGGLLLIRLILGSLFGLIIDLLVLLFKYKPIGYYISFIIGNAVSIPISVLVYTLLGFPGVEKLKEALLLFTLVTAFLSFIGILLGSYVYNKIKNKNIVRQISS